MTTTASLNKRIENLEASRASEDEKRVIIFVTYDNSPEKEQTSYIIERCEAATDKETYDNALGNALMALTGKNPLKSEKDVTFLTITQEVAMKTLENLREQGIAVSL